ncbi:MAG: plastocyanin/azurin family copper-binding protein [Bacteroidota bacterium]|nr:plastocyanin/azurin family copper-binding protein [Bacteroidota bacterium]
MRLFTILGVLFLVLHAGTATGTTHTITNSGFTFSPSSLTISVGDTVVFSIASSHNAVEVSQATWNSNGNTPLSGGFSVPFGGGTVIFSSAATHYYVCSPHASLGMKGVINVVQTTVSTGSISPTSFCKGDAVTVPYTASGGFTSGNSFTAQLSDATGGFASPTAIGSVSSTTSGQINATIPTTVAAGTGYRIRVVSSTPLVIAADNGTDLTVFDVPNASISPAGPTSFCDGSSVTLNALPTGSSLSYTWRRDGVVIPGATNASYVATVAGQYTVEVSNGSCASISAARPVIVFDADPTTLTWTAGVDTDWGTVGNWDSQCAVPTAGDTVIINGGVQPPSGIPALSLARLVLNNSAGISLSNDLEVTGTLEFSSGSITLGAANLTIAAGASITGAGAARFIVTDGSGELRQAGLGSGGRSGAVLFPVGVNAFSYTPISISNAGTLDEFRVAVREDVLDGGSSGSPLGTNVVDRTWFISEGTAGGSNADVLFSWNSGEELPAFTRTACYVAHHDGSDWVPLQSVGAATGGPVYQRAVTGVTAFSPFAIGDGSSPLPVEYRTLSADVQNERVQLLWETATESNNAGFEVQRRVSDVAQWRTLGFVSAQSNRGAASYRFTDTPPNGGSWMYRLRQIDLDGSATVSPVLRVELRMPARSFAIEDVYPNPLRLSSGGLVSLRVTVAEAGPVRLTLHDLLGRQVAMLYEGMLGEGSTATLRADLSTLSPGVYIYRFEQGTRTQHSRTVILR